MKTPPIHIVEELKRYEPALRLRWSKEHRQFVLERKADSAEYLAKPVTYRRKSDGSVKEVLCPENSDRYICYRDGYVPIFWTPKVDRRVLRRLYFSDSHRSRSRDEFIRKMEAREEAAEKRSDQFESDVLRNVSGEAYDSLAVKGGSRVFGGGLGAN